jgi:HAD superfamily hydrolase (TIGR01490 family)
VNIAFFDLDKTLLAHNAAWAWVRSEFAAGHVTPWQLLEATFWLSRYKFGYDRLQEPIRKSVATLRGKSSTELQERMLDFYGTNVRGRYRPGGQNAIDAERAKDNQCVLLTSGAEYLAKAVGEELRLDAVLCSRFETDSEGLFTGKVIEPFCFGPGKVVLARNYAASKGIVLDKCTFYSDSASDIPMLEGVGHPIAVNPDRRLRRHAKSRGWPTVDWGVPH